MSSLANGDSLSNNTPRKLKILMLHGYTQSGTLFHAKTRALEKALQKAFPPAPTTSTTASPSKAKPLLNPGTLSSYPGGVDLIYPTGPRKLRIADIPGFTPSSIAEPDLEEQDSYGWWQRNDHTGAYDGLDACFATIATTIRSVGGVDGAIGFSQGGALAPLLASLLEPGRAEAFAAWEARGAGIAYPKSFAELGDVQKQLRFAVVYSGFMAPAEMYGAFYEPKVETPTMHFLGTLDGVVEESRSLKLVERCVDAKAVYHPGGHFVPIGKEMVGALIGFIRGCCEDEEEKGVEEGVEDMEVPF